MAAKYSQCFDLLCIHIFALIILSYTYVFHTLHDVDNLKVIKKYSENIA